MATMTEAPTRLELRSAPFEVNEEIRRWQRRGDARARDRIFEHFFPMARRLSTRYRNPHEPSEDLAQVAAVGLLGAIDRFDPDHGARFEGYAIPTVLGELKRYFRDTGWSAHVPRRAKELALRVDAAAAQLAARNGRSPSIGQLADFMDIDVEEVVLGLEAGQGHYSGSLDATPSNGRSDDPLPLVELMGGADDRFDLIDTKLSLVAALSTLPHNERTALRMRLDDDLRQIDIATAMGCSQMQVSRVLRRAASRVRDQFDPVLGDG